MKDDDSQLQLLSIFHYIVGTCVGLFSLFPLIYVAIGFMFIVAPQQFAGKGPPPPPFLGWFFLIFGSVFVLIGETMAVCILMAGWCLSQRRRHLFCLIVAGVECMFMPFGTVLGVFTLIVLLRDSAKAQFTGQDPTTVAAEI